jgi:hypothetical protein
MERATRQAINSCLKGKPTIKKKSMPKEVLDKKLFIEIINTLREIEDKRWFMSDELGLDLSVYEDNYFLVIENLLKLHFNKEQIALINYYIYQIPTLENFDGTVDITDGKDMLTVNMETPEDLWNVVSSLEQGKLKK